ncbi:acyclic terpene utilization AtuA family protein [Salinisphaera aquimarina]|uniref:Acyclic terpene utilization AtuA family protein n=1 Tax=Salinisphaera aquimarina TaxID=2094031 RepID=A0ABV7EX16_9GAMM
MDSIRIGCASAFWGDTNTAAAQLVAGGELDYLVFDYLSEITMSILAAKRQRDANAGYAEDFVAHAIGPLLADIKTRGIRVISNAGGINLGACRDALAAVAEQVGLNFRIAIVTGDDLGARRDALEASITPQSGDAPLPERLASMNAYLGAPGIVAALDAGADIVITGRCVDSAVTLAPLVHAFGWAWDDYDKLAAGSLAGHIIECGAQCTGGNFTDWQQVAADFDDMGFPVVEVAADGTFVVTKPADTGGLVSPHTVGEQMLYEIGDPRAYLLPDVACDFTQVELIEDGADRVRVTGARGRAPNDAYKVSATYRDGYRATALFMVGGIDAAAKARANAEAIIRKTDRAFAAGGLARYAAVDIDTLGAESTYGPHARAAAAATREVVVKISVRHADREALELFTRELAQAATGMAPGVTGYFGGRPSVSPVIRLYSCFVPKSAADVAIDLDGHRQSIVIDTVGGFDADLLPPTHGETVWQPSADGVAIPLIRLALARSGDKGDDANIGVIARDPAYLPYLRAALTDAAVGQWFAHLLDGDVMHWELPGIHAFNFLLTRCLGGGGMASLRADAQGKCFGQMLLDMPVAVPAELAARLDSNPV